ncbi:MAG TPA: hypothetical protein VG916_08560 [Gemmatimonadaceae bacterium]|nr:hypothetical protein [Gemmatimonadaceae bacterium]
MTSLRWPGWARHPVPASAPGRLAPPWRALALGSCLAVAIALAPAATRGVRAQVAPRNTWPIKTREHVDLWLHGFAFVAPDSSPVPLYRAGYRDAMIVARNAASAITELDANADVLRSAIRARPNLLGAQFIPMEFGTWAELDAAMEAFIRADGDPNRAGRNDAALVARLASVFRTKDDRDFARRFMLGLRSEREKFHHEWWLAETRRRDAALTAVDSLWRTRYRPALQSFLNHTQQRDGEVILSTVLEAEGRTVTGGAQGNTIVVGFPERPEHAADAIYCLMHEMVGTITSAAVADNVTPAQTRSGEADKYQSLALVRGGAILAAHVGADAATAYQKFYLRATGHADTGDVAAAFAAAFPLPEAMLSSIERQVAVAFSGI